MPIQSSAESINVHEASWADLEISLDIPNGPTLTLLDFEGIKWSTKVDVAETRGARGRPKKRTRGAPSYEASATASRAGWMQVSEALEAAAIALGLQEGDQVNIGAVAFNVLLQHQPLGDSRVYAVKLTGCRLLGESSDSKQGADAEMIEVTLNPLLIAKQSNVTKNWIVLA